MSEVDRNEVFEEKATSQQVDLVNDPDAGLSDAEKKEVVRNLAQLAKLAVANSIVGAQARSKA